MNILKMACSGLKKPLLSAINKAVAENKDVVQKDLRIKKEKDYIMINLIVSPVSEPVDLRGLIMIKFEDVPYPEKISAKSSKKNNTADATRLADMEFQLISTKEDLQMTIEELESSNEELKSTNEELQSTNEELQSTNEELETSKEELQSLHEETETVNIELQRRIEELIVLSNDMQNLLVSTEIANIFLDMNLCIRRFTAKTTEFVELIESDIGRPLKHFAFHLKYDEILKDAENVIRNLNYIEKKVEDEHGRWFFVKIVPYRTMENKIDGVIIMFQDITSQKKMENDLKAALAELEIYRKK